MSNRLFFFMVFILILSSFAIAIPSIPNITYPALNYTRVINGTIIWNASSDINPSNINYSVYVNNTLNISNLSCCSYNIQGLISVRDYLITVNATNNTGSASSGSERIITFAEKLDYEIPIALLYTAIIGTLIYLFANIGSSGGKETNETE